MSEIKFVAEIKNSTTNELEYEIVSKSPTQLISVLERMGIVNGVEGRPLSVSLLLNHLFVEGKAYFGRNMCITVRSEEKSEARSRKNGGNENAIRCLCNTSECKNGRECKSSQTG